MNNLGRININQRRTIVTVNNHLPTVRLKRSFNQPDCQGVNMRFWTITGPNNHPNLYSDLSVEGLKEWGII